MTTIAYKDGYIAADTQAYLGRGESAHARKHKLNVLADGRVVAVSSAIVGAAFQFVRWIEEGANPESWPVIKDNERESDFEAIVVSPDGSLTYYHDNYLPSYIEAEHFAIGSGGPYALGAMEAGASAAGAVSIAIKFDPFSGGSPDIVRVVP